MSDEKEPSLFNIPSCSYEQWKGQPQKPISLDALLKAMSDAAEELSKPPPPPPPHFVSYRRYNRLKYFLEEIWKVEPNFRFDHPLSIELKAQELGIKPRPEDEYPHWTNKKMKILTEKELQEFFETCYRLHKNHSRFFNYSKMPEHELAFTTGVLQAMGKLLEGHRTMPDGSCECEKKNRGEGGRFE